MGYRYHHLLDQTEINCKVSFDFSVDGCVDGYRHTHFLYTTPLQEEISLPCKENPLQHNRKGYRG